MTGGRHSHGKISTIMKVKRYSKIIKGGPSLHVKSLYSHSNVFSFKCICGKELKKYARGKL